jgi:Ca2+-transporting ATPase
MVLLDDDLATIVAAVREGRGVYDNLRKVVDYLIPGNLAEILVVVCGLLFIPALGVPLLPLQLLWINLLTDGLPAVALGVDPSDPALMRREPRPRAVRLLTWSRVARLLSRGCVIAAVTLGALLVARGLLGASWEQARAVMFTTLVVAQLLYAFVIAGHGRGVATNPWLLAAVLAGLAAQTLIVLWPDAHQLFGTAVLSGVEWVVVVVAALTSTALLKVGTSVLATSGRSTLPRTPPQSDSGRTDRKGVQRWRRWAQAGSGLRWP